MSILTDSNPNLTKLENKQPFVECAVFADDIKFKGGSYQSPWHFFDKPLLDEGGTAKDFDFEIPTSNVTGAINAIVDMFNEEPDYQNNQYY